MAVKMCRCRCAPELESEHGYLVSDTLFNARKVITSRDCWAQVLSRTSEAEPYGWWPARIKMMKGEFAVVDYVGYESTYSDILPLDNVRHRNTKYVPHLSYVDCKSIKVD